MAPKDDGKVFWFGTVTNATPASLNGFHNLKDYIELDEDLSSGKKGETAPWMRVTASIPQGVTVDVEYIYYQTSDLEDLVGGAKKVGDYLATTR